jgi:hypothetical protein
MRERTGRPCRKDPDAVGCPSLHGAVGQEREAYLPSERSVVRKPGTEGSGQRVVDVSRRLDRPAQLHSQLQPCDRIESVRLDRDLAQEGRIDAGRFLAQPPSGSLDATRKCFCGGGQEPLAKRSGRRTVAHRRSIALPATATRQG